MSSDEARRTALKKSTSWGPVDDVGQQEAVFEYCEDLFQLSAGDDSEGTAGAENGAEQLDKHTYAFEVFCPEAITKAISRLALVDMETAAQIFLKGEIPRLGLCCQAKGKVVHWPVYYSPYAMLYYTTEEL